MVKANDLGRKVYNQNKSWLIAELVQGHHLLQPLEIVVTQLLDIASQYRHEDHGKSFLLVRNRS